MPQKRRDADITPPTFSSETGNFTYLLGVELDGRSKPFSRFAHSASATSQGSTGKERKQKMFESVTIREARSMVLVKTAFKLVVGAYLVIGMIAGYRAWFQVKSLRLQSTDTVLRPGSSIETNVVTYARTHVDVRVDLIQGTHSGTLAVQLVPGNVWAFFDPRNRQASQNVILTGDVLNRFEAGKAKLRATATGRPQLTRLPPPLVRELEVEISASKR